MFETGLHLVVSLGEFFDGDVDACSFIVPGALFVGEFGDVGDCTLEDGAFVLFAAGNDLGDFVDAFIYGFPAASFDCGGFVCIFFWNLLGEQLTLFVIVLSLDVPFIGTNCGFVYRQCHLTCRLKL